jgi:hypothetical protein
MQNVNGTSIQIPVNPQPEKWTVIALNALSYFAEHKCFASGSTNKFYLRSFKLQSCLSIKGVYTSDIAYSATTLPKDIQLKVPKDKDWFAEYNWLQLPQTDVNAEAVREVTVDDEPRKVQTQVNFASKEDMAATEVSEADRMARTVKKSNLKKKDGRNESVDDKKVTFPTMGT